MRVALTGTPGTGKTSVARILADRGYAVESFDNLAANHVVGHDSGRGCDVVDVASVNDAFQPAKDIIVEGHLSHLLDMEAAVVLRCHPETLQKRLQQKGWPETKVQENMAAEGLSIILAEAIERYGYQNIMEIDTTHQSPLQTTKRIITLIESKFTADKGEPIDWMEWMTNHVGQI
jgi:adenylate kinase